MTEQIQNFANGFQMKIPSRLVFISNDKVHLYSSFNGKEIQTKLFIAV